MVKICIIKTNNVSYSKHDNYLSRFSLENIEDSIEDYIKVSSLENENDFSNLVSHTINPPESSKLFTTTFFENEKNVYQIVHLATFDGSENNELNKKIMEKKYNGLGTVLVNEIYKIYGNVIVIKSEIKNDDTTKLADLTIKEFFDIFRQKKVTKGVLIKPNNEINEIEYVGNPLSWLDTAEAHNFRYYEKEILGQIFMFFIQIKPKEKKINKYACELYGNTHLIYGDLFIAVKEKPEDIRQENDSYIHIDKNIILKLKNLIINTEFSKDHEPFKFNPTSRKYENFYTLLDKCDRHFSKQKEKKLIDFPDENSRSLNEITNTIISSVSN